MKFITYNNLNPINLIKVGILFWALNVFIAQLNPISLYIIIPLSFIYCFTRYKIFNKNRYFRLYVWVMIWIVLTCFSSHYFDLSLKEIKSDIPVIMMCYICCCLADDYKNFKFLYWIWIAFFIGIFIYAFHSGLMSSMDITKTRLDDDELNANVVAYATFYMTFSLYMLGDLMRKTDTYRKLFFLTIPISFIIALLTASRQVLIIQIPLIFLLISVRYADIFNRAKTVVVGLCVIILGSFYVGDKISNIYQNSLLAQRAQKKLEKDSRTKLLKDALSVGLDYPVVGVGPSNYVKFSYNHHFSHCTYTELFACSGVPALFLYILIIFVLIRKQIVYFVETKDKTFLSFLVFGVIFFIDNFFYVFYLRIYLMPILLIVGSHSDMYYKRIKYLELFNASVNN